MLLSVNSFASFHFIEDEEIGKFQKILKSIIFMKIVNVDYYLFGRILVDRVYNRETIIKEKQFDWYPCEEAIKKILTLYIIHVEIFEVQQFLFLQNI